jgi:hypothetical protein
MKILKYQAILLSIFFYLPSFLKGQCLNEIKYEFWFGVLINCDVSLYTLDSAKSICSQNNLYNLAEIFDAYLYKNITQELSLRTK